MANNKDLVQEYLVKKLQKLEKELEKLQAENEKLKDFEMKYYILKSLFKLTPAQGTGIDAIELVDFSGGFKSYVAFSCDEDYEKIKAVL